MSPADARTAPSAPTTCTSYCPASDPTGNSSISFTFARGRTSGGRSSAGASLRVTLYLRRSSVTSTGSASATICSGAGAGEAWRFP